MNLTFRKDMQESLNRYRMKIGPERQEVRDDVPGRRDQAFRAFVAKRNRGHGKLSVTLKDWITVNDGADWARKQCHEYYDEVMAERKRGKQ